LKQVLAAALAIAVTGSALGVLRNGFATTPLPILRTYPGVLAPLSTVQAQLWFLEKSAVFVDARPSTKWAAGHIQGSVNWPARGGPYRVPRGYRRIVLYGEDEMIPKYLWASLKDQGIQMYLLTGGIGSWKQAGLPISAL
jgi:rhodanese-related sulfurtransferase